VIELVMNKPEAPVKIECPKCRGSGLYRATYGGYVGSCNRCKGRKVIEVPAAELEAKRSAQVAKGNALAEKIKAWKAAHPAEHAWLEAEGGKGNGFALSLSCGLERYGALTDNQLAAVQRNLGKGQAPAAAGAPAASMPAVEAAFAKAMAAGIKRPKMRLGGFTVSPAPATGQNAGAIYVKSDDGVYLGKIMAGAFRRSRDCSGELEAKVLEIAKDPKAAAIAYGKQYGVCSVCGRELSDPESVERGIGPICAERFGW
jgi:hypothetical protein